MAEQKPTLKGRQAVKRQISEAQTVSTPDQNAIAEQVEQIVSMIVLPGQLSLRQDADPEAIKEKFRAFFIALLNGSSLQFAVDGSRIGNTKFREWMRKGGDAAHNGDVDKTDKAEEPFKTFALTVRACQANAVNSLYGYVMSAAKTDWRAAQVLLNRRDPVPQQGLTAAVSVQTDQDQSKTQVLIYIPDNGREQVVGYDGSGASGESGVSGELPPVSATQPEVIEAEVVEIDDVPNFEDMPMDEVE